MTTYNPDNDITYQEKVQILGGRPDWMPEELSARAAASILSEGISEKELKTMISTGADLTQIQNIGRRTASEIKSVFAIAEKGG